MNRNPPVTIDFDEFVKRQQALSPERREIDWVAERDKWLAHLEKLYDQLELFLSSTRSRQIALSYDQNQLDEESIGSYTVRQMTLKIGRQKVP